MYIALLRNDTSSTDTLSLWLRRAGNEVRRLQDPAELRALVPARRFVVLLHCSQATSAALELVSATRSIVQSRAPILVVAASNREEHVAGALRGGADDYMSEPVRKHELLARLEVLGRRYAAHAERDQVLAIEPFELHLAAGVVRKHGVDVLMTRKDITLFELLLRNVGRLVTRSEIARTVWGDVLAAQSRTIDTHIHRIRNKLELSAEHGWELSARYGKGYRLDRLHRRAALPRHAEPARDERMHS